TACLLVRSPRSRVASCCGPLPPLRAAPKHVRPPPEATGMSAQSEPGDLPKPREIPRQLLEYLAECLVDTPEKVSVERFDGDRGTIVLELCVAPDDYGRVIGRGGRTAHALRAGVKAAATGEGSRVLVGIGGSAGA